MATRMWGLSVCMACYIRGKGGQGCIGTGGGGREGLRPPPPPFTAYAQQRLPDGKYQLQWHL